MGQPSQVEPTPVLAAQGSAALPGTPPSPSQAPGHIRTRWGTGGPRQDVALPWVLGLSWGGGGGQLALHRKAESGGWPSQALPGCPPSTPYLAWVRSRRAGSEARPGCSCLSPSMVDTPPSLRPCCPSRSGSAGLPKSPSSPPASTPATNGALTQPWAPRPSPGPLAPVRPAPLPEPPCAA